MGRGLARGLASALLLVSASALADTRPSLWESAREPGARTRYALHVTVRQILDFESRVPLARFGALDRARTLLEDAQAERSPEPTLRFDLGEVYYALDLHDEAVRVLVPALAEHGDHPAGTEALLSLAYSFAKLDRPREERDAYLRFLARTTNDRARVTATLNLAEAEMRLGNLREAIAGYQEAIALSSSLPQFASSQESGTLAVWGLAVAQDRSGDPMAARASATRALGLDPGMALVAHGPNVFFVPEYERLWYLALGDEAEAARSPEPRQALRHLRSAELFWRTYVDKATGTDRWLAHARAHLASAKRATAAAIARAGKAPLVVDPNKVFQF